MKREKVDSSIIYAIGYDGEKHVLEIEFVDGAVFQYGGVPNSEYRHLMAAGSLGRYFLRHIRDRYPTSVLEKGSRRATWY